MTYNYSGFETVSYLLKGAFVGEDSTGRKSLTEAGDVVWMTAGKGKQILFLLS